MIVAIPDNATISLRNVTGANCFVTNFPNDGNTASLMVLRIK